VKTAGVTRPLLPLAAVTAGLASGSSLAAEWTFTPSGELVTQSQQNPYLSPDEDKKNDVSNGLAAMAALGVQRRTERSLFTLQPAMRAYRYDNSSTLDRDEQRVALAFNWEGEKVAWRTSADVTRDTTLTSELGNTGLTQGNQRHEAYRLSVSPTWTVSERWQAQTSVDSQDSRYPNPGFGLANYRYSTWMVGTTYVATEKLAYTLYGTAGLLDSERQGSDTTDTSANLSMQYAWSPLTSLSISVGPSWVKTDGGREQGLRYRLAVSRALEKSAISLSLGRRQAPSGRALLTEVDEAALTFVTQITERLSATAAATYTKRRNVLRVFGVDLERVNYARADLGLAWRVSSNWRLNFNVGGGQQQVGSAFFADELTGRGYDVRLGLSWNGDPYVR
jgi:hypothetical protein